MKLLTTTLHTYYFDLSNPKEKEAYGMLKAKMKAQHTACFESRGNGSHYFGSDLDGQIIQLETDCLFNNQWNTAPFDKYKRGLRVFDWAQDYLPNKNIKRGHYLHITVEMKEIRRNTNKCGYCGKMQPAANGAVFCTLCLDSEFLKHSDLMLLRLRAIDETDKTCPPLTEAELDFLLPLYKDAQLHGNTAKGKTRLAQKRKDIEDKYKREIYGAKVEHAGFLWLMDHGINTDNVIYYAHTDKFCFGWRHPVEPVIKSDILDIISEFPFNYEIK